MFVPMFFVGFKKIILKFRSFHLILRSLDDDHDVFSDNFVFDIDGVQKNVPVRDFLVYGQDKSKFIFLFSNISRCS